MAAFVSAFCSGWKERVLGVAGRDVKVALTYRTPKNNHVIEPIALLPETDKSGSHQTSRRPLPTHNLPALSPILISPHLASLERGELGSLWPSLIAFTTSFSTAFPISQVPLGQHGLCSTRLQRQTRHIPRDDTNKIYYVTKACNRWW